MSPTLLSRIKVLVREQDQGGAAKEYLFSEAIAKEIRLALVNSEGSDDEAEFLLSQFVNSDKEPIIAVPHYYVNHLIDFLHGES